MSRLVLAPLDLITSALLVVLFLLVWLISLPRLCRFWQYTLGEGLRILGLRAALGLREHHFTPYVRFVLPYPRMEGIFPDAQTWWLTLAIVCVLLVVSFLLPQKLTPVNYLLRLVAFIHTTSLLVFLWEPARFPHTPDSYMEGLVGYGIALISFVPVLFGFTYYILNFGLTRKVLLTAVTMIHLSLFLPVHILLQATILQKSVLFMPLLYIVFGLPVEVLMIIAFYSWGMSWATKPPPAI